MRSVVNAVVEEIQADLLRNVITPLSKREHPIQAAHLPENGFLSTKLRSTRIGKTGSEKLSTAGRKRLQAAKISGAERFTLMGLRNGWQS